MLIVNRTKLYCTEYTSPLRLSTCSLIVSPICFIQLEGTFRRIVSHINQVHTQRLLSIIILPLSHEVSKPLVS
jgi:hypothetical protein